MYARNTIAKRRSPGWAERRRHFRRLFEQTRAKALKEVEEPQKAALVGEKD